MRFLFATVLMGLFSLFSSCENKSPDVKSPAPGEALVIDLGTFRVGDTLLGEKPAATDSFAAALQTSEVFEDSNKGIEIAVKNGVLDYAFLTIADYSGKFLRDGKAIEIGATLTEAQILAQFGEPYWTDRSDGETIMFYEYSNGTVELQFEFPDAQALGFITLTRDGTLSKEEQRKLYGVTKPWPPR